MITYNDIYEAARKERYSNQLQALPKSFLDSVSEYFRDKKEMAAKSAGDFSEVITKTKKQLENALTLFRELMLRRRKKILGLVLIAAETGISKQDFDNMLKLEKDLFEELMKCVEESDKKLDISLNGKEEKKKNQLVVFEESVNELMSPDGGKMGPFEKGQIANIPKEIAKILIDDDKAKELD